MDTSDAPRPWRRPMRPRRRDEPHRAATPLELFFDLSFVVAVTQAAGGLHDALVAGRIGHAVVSYLMVFFGIWWAWMNVTWFASAYDTDDDLYRLSTLVQVAGALILAAGVPQAFEGADYALATLGYVVMRLATVGNWLRAAAGDPAHRRTALRFAAGVTGVQLGWLLRLLVPPGLGAVSFLVLALADLLVPVLAERRAMTSWHPRHIAERYGLFALIVLGEVVLAITVAVQTGISSGDEWLWPLAGAGTAIVFALWWLYFDRPVRVPASLNGALTWGYGHYAVFAGLGAVGAGLGVAVERQQHPAEVDPLVAGYAVAVPVAVVLLVLWGLRMLSVRQRARPAAVPLAAVAVLLTPLTPVPVYLVAVVLVGLAAALRWPATGPAASR
ncbi:low temperature requirement protein A [Verrucosispora sp. WMMA2121]|uniref:low temperature requirement protein A n=1 Tax=Verrucosispora sp. WMMA2121 TaxID=3015164 RepID=UPI0022B68563|nr:low temperature requirement protein A [Verrucosispora sp. WMMA2121]MCZ7423043.1 low temperature requirement protein A [Verrucosispora sp. WMMA2121]